MGTEEPFEVSSTESLCQDHAPRGDHLRIAAPGQRVAVGQDLVELVVQSLGQVVAEHGGAPQRRHGHLHGRVVGAQSLETKPRCSNRPNDVDPRDGYHYHDTLCPKAVHVCALAEGPLYDHKENVDFHHLLCFPHASSVFYYIMGFFLPTPMLVAVVAVWRNGIFFQNRASRGGEAPAPKIPFPRACAPFTEAMRPRAVAAKAPAETPQ